MGTSFPGFFSGPIAGPALQIEPTQVQLNTGPSHHSPCPSRASPDQAALQPSDLTLSQIGHSREGKS